MSITSAVVADALAKKAPVALYQALKRLGASNSEAASEEFREAMEAMTVAMAARYDWGPVPDDEKPTAEDARNTAREFKREYERASGNPKRKLLFSAFFGYFNPKFYRSGMSKILWDYAVQLEYPDAEFLRRAMESIRKQMRGTSERAQLIETGPGARRVWTPTEMPVNCTSLDYEIALRLERMGFVRFISTDSDSYVRVAPKLELVAQLMEFVWEQSDTEIAEDAEEPGDDSPAR